MKKCRSTVLIILVIFLMLPITARADVLFVPNNSFYERHSSECTYLNRYFYTNSKDGFVIIKKEPGSKTETAAIENGETVNIIFTYNHNGELWGVTEIYTPGKNSSERPNGWIPMNQLLLKYDYISFEEDHRDEIYDYTGDDEALTNAPELVLWSWPGSGSVSHTMQGPLSSSGYGGPLDFPYAYMDEEGREWGYLSYWYGIRNLWVCISDPSNADIPAFNPAPAPELWQSSAPPDTGGRLSAPWLVTILVVVLVVGTVILVRVFWKPKKEDI